VSSDSPRLSSAEVSCYLGAADWLTAVVSRPEIGEAWTQPSSLANYSVGGVAAHVVQGALERLVALLESPEPDGLRSVDIPVFFAPNRMDGPEDDDPLFVGLRRLSEEHALQGQAAVVQRARVARHQLASVLPTIAADRRMPLVRLPDACSTASDTLRTRVLELIVHGDDLVASVPDLVVPAPPSDAVDTCLSVCLELARARVGDVAVLRAFTRAERAEEGALRVL
jgi:Mycothiol maleylpyruvate isomerase N-terminal domain